MLIDFYFYITMPNYSVRLLVSCTDNPMIRVALRFHQRCVFGEGTIYLILGMIRITTRMQDPQLLPYLHMNVLLTRRKFARLAHIFTVKQICHCIFSSTHYIRHMYFLYII